ncbi:thermonuclease family protein [Sphingopyxis sp. GW247-27LB]|uniref:thermonuclease family protein n=1 Tax=Sphingopyxis sp. GW247-27LB TaxID=2012632 RepID=UPI000BA534BE|nr:hypothetical protein [Sphingopyxis sp. GW247-27LB]PAL24541.1 hypothetical protein CD928_03845 [Sphingopyxis sp. GW247-27LB]
MADLPPPPPGFTVERAPPRRRSRDRSTSGETPGRSYTATGRTIDGDTIQLQPPPNALGPLNGRLSGYDAFERDQMGYRADGTPVALGSDSMNALAAFATPRTTVIGVGPQSYGRPVVGLTVAGQDPVNALLRAGQGYAAPEYLSADPERAASYMESERLGRLNRQGAFGTAHIRPDAYRRPLTTRTAKLAADEYLAFDDQLPADAPKLKRLTPEQEGKIARYIASQAGNPNFSLKQYRDWFRNDLGVTDIEPSDNPDFIESVRKGEGFSPSVDYGVLDAESQRELQELIAFSGMRPEDAQGFRDLLKSGDQAKVLEYARSKGMTLDPRDVSAYFAARAKGEAASIPLPIIDPGDEGLGAAARGFGDPLGFLDEMGAVVDTIGGTENRESIWNSDRSFGEIYDNNARQNRAIIDYDETQHPFYRGGGQLVSGVALPFGSGVRGATGLAKAGAVEGAIYGFGSGDGTLGQRLANVPVNATIGAVGGAAVGKVIDVGAPLIRKGAERLFRSAEELPPPPPGFQIAQPVAADPPVGAANMSGDALPSVSSPHQPDVINVSANQATRLLDGPSDAMLRVAAARVEPGDVLPRPANEVQSLEEAARISDGVYPEVPAPRERDYLETTQYPSRANPDATITRKGPADLVTFMRSLNGVRDEGGELTAAGISNAARKGDDFAGGENRLGKLVNPEGLSLEEAAQRAYDEGYFPDLDAPPTNAEFLAALDNTYRGVGRRFRPEDEGQIQAFEGARDQRLAVERARQEGAPLVDDVGKPATLDDMIANTPPATAYDDWNNAVVSKVGNIQVDKLDTPQEIGQALKIADNVAGGFDAARRGKISFAETQALAQDLGMTPDDLLARRKGQAFSAEEAYAARAILAKSGNELVNMARRLRSMGDDPGSEALAAFRKALLRHAAIQEQVSGMTAEAGRALSAFRMTANSRDVPGHVLEGLANAGGGPQRLKDAAEAIITLERDPASLNRFVEVASKPKFKDKLLELWYNFLLSGPQTHAVNILSNTMTSLSQIPEHAIAAGIGKLRSLTPSARRAAEDRISFTEVASRATALIQGAKEGMREAAYAFRTGEPRDFVTKVEAQSQKAISGKKGEFVRLPSRFLTAEDELFKGMARRMELTGLAIRQARKEGLRGEDGRRRVAELLSNPTGDMWEQVMDYGRYVTFQRPLGPHASKIAAFTNDLPITKAVLPFIRTPTNLFKFAIERSPAAPILREWRKDFAAGGARRDLAVARAAVGTAMGTLFAYLAEQGYITGSAPRDRNKRALMMADGWQPYSVKIGDKFYSYQRLDPFALTVGAAADMATLGEGMSEGQKAKGAALVWASIMGNLSNKTWLAGVSDIVAAIDDPERYGGNFIDRFAGSATVPTGVAQVARTVDPAMRETESTLDYVQSRVPGLSDNLLPKRDVWGRPIEKEGGVGPDIMSPIWTSTAKADPATWEAIRLDAPINLPADDDNMTPEQMDRWRMLSGQTAHQWVSELIKQPGYREQDAEGQRKAIAHVMKEARARTKANVLAGVPIPTSRPEKGQRRKAPPPPGFEAMPPIPEGFVPVQ